MSMHSEVRIEVQAPVLPLTKCDCYSLNEKWGSSSSVDTLGSLWTLWERGLANGQTHLGVYF